MKGTIYLFFVIIGVSILSSCVFVPPSATCSLSNPEVSNNQVIVPFTVDIDGQYSAFTTTVTLSFTICIDVNTSGSRFIRSYITEVNHDLNHSDHHYSDSVVFSITDKESYIVGSAHASKVKITENCGFICNNIKNLTTASTCLGYCHKTCSRFARQVLRQCTPRRLSIS